MDTIKSLFTATATATGGRNGHSKASDGSVSVDLSTIDFKLWEENRRGEVGYTKRTASDEDFRDDKEFFHFHPQIFSRYHIFIDDQPIEKIKTT